MYVLLALALMAAVAAATWTTGGRSARRVPTRVVELRLGRGTASRVVVRDRGGARLPAAAVSASMPRRVTVRMGVATVVRRVDRRRTAGRALGSTGRPVQVVSRPESSRIAAPVVAQRLPNNCESAALEVLLATTGRRVDQLTLQRQLATSGPLDPRGPSPVWGDPDRGYVGRADGTGTWGGFGVYPGPVARLAARYGRHLRDLGRGPATAVFDEVLAGHAVMAWIGLGDGPYRAWIAPSGRRIRVNLNEHTVVVTGVREDGRLTIVNVLKGTREVWSRPRFARAWQLLGRRALAVTS